MKRMAPAMLALMTGLLLGAGSACSADGEHAASWDEAEIVETIGALSDAELDAMAMEFEAVEQAQIEANLRFNEAQRNYLARVVAAAAASGELEHEVAALLLAGSFSMRGHDFEPGILDGLMTRAMAGAALRPDLLNALDISCGLLASAWTPTNPDATRAPPPACDESGTRRKLTAIEPANAHHWIRRLDSDLRAGDHELARAHLLATTRSTYWRPAFRTILHLMHAALTRWPPGEDLTEAARAVSESLAQAGTLGASDMAYFEAWRDSRAFVAQTTMGLSLILPIGPHQPMLELCRAAVAAPDRAGIAACARLARLMIGSEDSVMDVMVGYALLIEVEPPAAAARAEAERDALRTGMLEAYRSALTEHGVTQDLVADLANWIEHGEIEMTRRGLARVEAELARRAAARDEENPN